MPVLDLSSDVYDETSLMRHLIKLDENDSSNLMSENVISSNDESGSSNDVSGSSNLRDENVISSNDESGSSNLTKRQTVFLLSDEQSSAVILDMKNLILQKVVF
jgi:hypothetical protein